jgi:hypothetical protein
MDLEGSGVQSSDVEVWRTSNSSPGMLDMVAVYGVYYEYRIDGISEAHCRGKMVQYKHAILKVVTSNTHGKDNPICHLVQSAARMLT